MIITGAVFGSIAFAVQGLNAWHNKKNAKKLQELQELYESEVQKKMSALAKEQFEKLCKAKREIAEEEYNAQIKLLEDLHQENLRSIEYLASLDKWPLAVMPLVMRNDSLFFNTQAIDTNKNRNDIVPISIILGPCRDKAFQSAIWRKVEEQLAQHFCSYWGIMSSHPIIFYQDAWKNEMDPADGSSFADIHAKIKNVPTIIISPILTRANSLQLEISHWCIKGLDTEESYVNETRISLPEGSHVYKREANYNDEDIPSLVNELCNYIESLIGFMSDQYMWLRYHEAPLLPTLVQKGVIICDESERNNLYKFSFDMLAMSLNTGDVNALTEIDCILKYCESIDIPLKRNDGFLSLIKKITLSPEDDDINHQINNIIDFNSKFFLSLYKYCNAYQGFYDIDDCTHVYEKYLYMLCAEGVETWCSKYGENHYPWTKAGCREKADEIALDICKSYISRFKWKLKSALETSANLYGSICGISVKFARNIYYNDIKKCIEEDFSKSKIDYELSKYQFQCLRKAINEVVSRLIFSFETEDLLKNVLECKLRNKYVTSQEFSSSFKLGVSVDIDCETLSKKSVGYWCEENFFSDNRLRSSISSYEQNDIDNFILTTLKNSIASYIQTYIGYNNDNSPIVETSSFDEHDEYDPIYCSSLYSG